MTTGPIFGAASARAQKALIRARLRLDPRRHPSDGHDAEAGDSLVEVLIAIVVLGIAAVAMLTAFGTIFSSTQEHRNLSNIQTAEKSVVQQITAQLVNESRYVSCTTISTYQTGGSSAVTFTGLPNGYSAQVTGLGYWTGSYPFSGNQAQCIANSPQLITATVTFPAAVKGGSSTVTAIVDSPTTPGLQPAGSAVGLKWYAQPVNTLAAQSMNPKPVVEVVDQNGDAVQNDFSTVQLQLNASNGATLTGCFGSENFGYVTFTGCSINQAGGPYTLTATDVSLPGVQAISSTFTISVGPPSQIVFSRAPAGASGGSAFATQPQVTVRDAGGNTVTTDTSTATLGITTGTGTSGATLSGCTQNETAGVITFGGCAINLAGTGYSLTATDGTMTATSATFTVATGSAAKLVFSTSPTASASGVAFTQQPVVTVEDAGGNTVTTATNSITLAINSQPTSGASFSCTAITKSATNGIATFAGCKITNATGEQGAYTLKATASALTTGLSTSFTVAGTASKLAFATSPSASVSAVAFPTQPVVWVEDSSGDLVTNSTASITLAINTQPTSGASLSCTTNPKTASGGIATFAGCKITNATGEQGAYTLAATSGTLTQGNSTSFTVAGAPAKLAFTQQPSSSTGGIAFPTQPTVTIEDSSGNVVTNNTSTVSLAITSGTGTVGATLSCTSQAAVAGVASFSGCDINKVGNGYTLRATDGMLTAATSSAINITLGPAAQLAFATNPGGGANGAQWTTQPTVSVQDAGGNAVTTATNTISLTIGSQPGSGATLTCSANPVIAVGGTSTFSGCQIVGTAGSYTLKASSVGLANGTSVPFTISVGPAAQLGFTTQPGGGANAATWSTQPAVTVEDSGGNKVTTSTASISLSLGQDPGGSLTCTANPLAATGGAATFTGCKITGIAGTYSLSASATGLSSASSNSFSVTFGTASQLVFTAQPGGGPNGAAWTTQPVVTAEDVSGNVVTTFSSNVTLAIKSQPGTGATLQCTTNPLTASAGVASFAGCQISGAVGSYTIGATSGSLTGTSSAFDVTIGAPAQLAFATQPGGGTDGTAWGTQPVVSVEDAGGNLVTSATDSVTLAVSSQPGSGATLGCTANPLSATGGSASFGGCQITGKTGSYTVAASAPGLTGVQSTSFTIAIGAASKLAFTTQPGGAANGSVWGTQPSITVQDVGGNTVSAATNSITLAIGTNPGGTLACTTNPLAASGGTASFAGCKITGKAGPYTLTAAATGLAGATSSSFTITAGAASQVAFTAQPSGGADGASWTTQPVVSIEDSSGNIVNSNAQITLAINSQPGTGATLACTANPLAATNGTASFAGCKITGKTGSYTLAASATGLNGATSSSFSITAGAATQLVFGTQPGGGANGAVWATQPAVNVEDVGGNIVPTATNAITLAVGTNPGGTLACTTNPLAAAGGTASFAGCKITGKTGSYSLTASATGLTTATSTPFTITPGAASQLAFSTQPGGGANGASWTSQPAVTVEDGSGNVVTNSTASITLAIGTNPGGTLACTTNPLAASSGTASFAGCKITGKAGSYTLTASTSGLPSVTSSAFTITFGTASQLIFTTQPGGGADAVAWTTQPAVTVEDGSGNVVTNSTASITLALGTNPGGALACTANPLSPTNGVATFGSCRITGKTGTYTLTASATGLTGATSNSVSITIGTASQLVFANEPGGGVDGTTWTAGNQPSVTVQDAGGNTVTTATNSITLAITTQPGSGAALACTTNPLAAAGGTASFAGCKITGKTGSYTLSASATGLTTATSTPFTMTVGGATQLVFSTQPGGGANGAAWTTQPAVSVEDVGGNTVPSATNSITLAIGTNPGGTLACTTNPLAASSGTASFAGCKITGKAGSSYTLTASTSGLPSVTSSAFTITFGTASQLIFTTQPGGGADAVAWTTQPAVTVEDGSGNVVTNSTASITLALGTNPGGALACTANPLSPTNGVATFGSCRITGKTGTYTLTASATGLTGATSNSVSITIGTASQLVFANEPGGGVDGTTWTAGNQPSVTVQDAGGNTVTTATNSITLAITTQPGSGAALACTTNPLAAAGGTASFAGCKITGKTGSYTLSASATGLTTATSTPFTMTVGGATQLVFSTQPGGGANGAAWTTQPAVSVEDVGGNTVPSATNSITLAIGTNPGGTLACTTNPLAASSGTASFAGCKITGKAGSSYTLTASTSGLPSVTSSAFTIAFGTASQLIFTTQPGTGTNGVVEGTAWTTQPIVTVEDASGNIVTNYSTGITLSVKTYSAGGSGGSASGAVSNCTDPLTPTNGVAAFSGCEITGTAAAGTYTLQVGSGSLSTTSGSISIVAGSASQLVFTTQPGGSVTEGAAFTQPIVTAEDASGNAVTGYTTAVTLAINGYTAGNGGSSQGTLGCTGSTTQTPSGGVATFSGCDITATSAAGTYTFQATSGNGSHTLTSQTSAGVTIVAGTGTKLVFTTEPGNGFGSGFSLNPQPAVSVEDANSNVVVTATNAITLALNSGTGTFSCTTNPVAASAGTATFSGCRVTHTGGTKSYTIIATATLSGNLVTSPSSNTFTT